MQSFKTFILESSDEEKTHSLFHTSPKPINKVGNSPMWFAHTKENADAYHQNSLDNHGSAHTYSAEVRGNIAHHTDPKVKKILSEAGVDHEDYSNDLVSNPTREEVEDHPGTHALKTAGYHGYTHSDYDPIDPDKDADTTVVFNPSNRVSLTKIK